MIANKYGKMINEKILDQEKKYIEHMKKNNQIPVYYDFTFPDPMDFGQAGSYGTGNGYFHVNTMNTNTKGGKRIYQIYKKKKK